jgi:hypothetical protein
MFADPSVARLPPFRLSRVVLDPGGQRVACCASAPIRTKTAAPAPATAFASRPPGPPTPAIGARSAGTPGAGFCRAYRRGAAARIRWSVRGRGRQLGLAAGGGKPLPEAVRGQMETALAADFSAVRVRVGPQAERIGAIAFTLGSDIYFVPGGYQPDTVHGQQLLGHELAHVVQQRAGRFAQSARLRARRRPGPCSSKPKPVASANVPPCTGSLPRQGCRPGRRNRRRRCELDPAATGSPPARAVARSASTRAAFHEQGRRSRECWGR